MTATLAHITTTVTGLVTEFVLILAEAACEWFLAWRRGVVV